MIPPTLHGRIVIVSCRARPDQCHPWGRTHDRSARSRLCERRGDGDGRAVLALAASSTDSIKGVRSEVVSSGSIPSPSSRCTAPRLPVQTAYQSVSSAIGTDPVLAGVPLIDQCFVQPDPFPPFQHRRRPLWWSQELPCSRPGRSSARRCRPAGQRHRCPGARR